MVRRRHHPCAGVAGEFARGVGDVVVQAAEAPYGSLWGARLQEVRKVISTTAHFQAIANPYILERAKEPVAMARAIRHGAIDAHPKGGLGGGPHLAPDRDHVRALEEPSEVPLVEVVAVVALRGGSRDRRPCAARRLS